MHLVVSYDAVSSDEPFSSALEIVYVLKGNELMRLRYCSTSGF